MAFIILGVGFLLAHLVILGLGIKLYTEIMKERYQSARKDRT